MVEQLDLPERAQNDRTMAALLPLMGVIAPIVIWATQKDKSEYVAFQGKNFRYLILGNWLGRYLERNN